MGHLPGRYSGEFERIKRFNSFQIGQKTSMDLRMNGNIPEEEKESELREFKQHPAVPEENEKKKQTWYQEPASSTRNKIKASSSLEFGSSKTT